MTHSPIDTNFGIEDQGATPTVRESDIKYTIALNSILTTKCTTFILLRLSRLIQHCAREGHFDWAIHIINHHVPKLTDRIALFAHLKNHAKSLEKIDEGKYYQRNYRQHLIDLSDCFNQYNTRTILQTKVSLFKAFRDLNLLNHAFCVLKYLPDNMPNKLLYLREVENRERIALKKTGSSSEYADLIDVKRRVQASISRLQLQRSFLSSET